VVARGALVLAADDEVAGDTAAGGAAVTLLLTEDEALAVSYASTAGIVMVALVPPEEARLPAE
jgi:Flp pilus assembly protein CpaB